MHSPRVIPLYSSLFLSIPLYSANHSFAPELKMQPPQVVYNQKFGRGVRVSKTKVAYQALITVRGGGGGGGGQEVAGTD